MRLGPLCAFPSRPPYLCVVLGVFCWCGSMPSMKMPPACSSSSSLGLLRLPSAKYLSRFLFNYINKIGGWGWDWASKHTKAAPNCTSLDTIDTILTKLLGTSQDLLFPHHSSCSICVFIDMKSNNASCVTSASQSNSISPLLSGLFAHLPLLNHIIRTCFFTGIAQFCTQLYDHHS